jgi:Transglycosylase-like domain
MQYDATADDHTIAHEPTLLERPPRRGRRPRRIGMLLGIATLAIAASACTPEEVAFVTSVSAPYEHELSAQQLETLRQCESGGNYEAVDRTGSFRGAYQFTRGTWDSVASRHFEWLVGVDPAEADPWWQDVMTRALYRERGRAPWPVCGRHM